VQDEAHSSRRGSERAGSVGFGSALSASIILVDVTGRRRKGKSGRDMGTAGIQLFDS